MLDIISVLLLPLAFFICVALLVVDLKTRLLPNVLVLSLAVCGLAFQICSLFFYDDFISIGAAAFLGGGLLYLIRAVGNHFYDTDTLGLGDVKLLAAGGVWLGVDYIMPALVVGAIAGIIHGGLLIIHGWVKTKTRPALHSFSLPAGPGFIFGLVFIALVKFYGLPHLYFS